MYQSWSIENQFEAFAAWGYDGAELAPFALATEPNATRPNETPLDRIDAATRLRILNASRNTGVAVAGLHWILARASGFHLNDPDFDTRRRTSEYLARLAEFCAELGGEYMVLGSPAQRRVAEGRAYDDAVACALETIEAVLPTLDKVGVTLALEPLAPTETNFWVNSEETLDFIAKLGAPERVKLHLDCKAMHGGEYQAIDDVIRRVAQTHRCVSFHANDPNLQGPGFGALNFAPIMQALVETGFNGWIGVEPFDYSPGIVELGRESLRNLKKALQTNS